MSPFGMLSIDSESIRLKSGNPKFSEEVATINGKSTNYTEKDILCNIVFMSINRPESFVDVVRRFSFPIPFKTRIKAIPT